MSDLRLHSLPMLRAVKAGWLVRGALVVLGVLAIVYCAGGDRTLSGIEEQLGRRFDGLRSALDAARDALRANSGCAADCRRMLLQAVRRAMFRL